MKKDNQYENAARFFVIGVVGLILILLLIVISSSANAEKTGKTGYLTFPLCAVWELKALHYQTDKNFIKCTK